MSGSGSVGIAVILLRSTLASAGWSLLEYEDGQLMLLPTARGAIRKGCPNPRIVPRPVSDGGRLWWHWVSPPPIAGIPIAPVADGHRARPLIVSTLAKLAKAS